MIVTGIGSRETPEEVLKQMVKVGQWCKRNKIRLRSGHAEGADIAFEQGAQENCIAYVPWKGFNKEYKTKAKLIVPEFTTELFATVDTYHSNPLGLSPSVRKIMARNACQVLGERLTEHSDVVICWTAGGREVGGTGQALRIAIAYGIPIWNMFKPDYSTADQLIHKLQLLWKTSYET